MMISLRKLEQVLGSNIAHLRKSLDLGTQERVAEMAGIPFRTYQDIERGLNWPEKRNVEAIAKAFRVPESRLFFDPDCLPPRLKLIDLLLRMGINEIDFEALYQLISKAQNTFRRD